MHCRGHYGATAAEMRQVRAVAVVKRLPIGAVVNLDSRRLVSVFASHVHIEFVPFTQNISVHDA